MTTKLFVSVLSMALWFACAAPVEELAAQADEAALASGKLYFQVVKRGRVFHATRINAGPQYHVSHMASEVYGPGKVEWFRGQAEASPQLAYGEVIDGTLWLDVLYQKQGQPHFDSVQQIALPAENDPNRDWVIHYLYSGGYGRAATISNDSGATLVEGYLRLSDNNFGVTTRFFPVAVP